MAAGTNNFITIDQAIEKFADYLTGCKHPPLTIKTYVENVWYWRVWLKNNSPAQNIAGLTRDDATEYLISLAKEGSGRPYIQQSVPSPAGIGATTLKKKLAAIRKFSLFLVEFGYHTIDITQGIKSPRVPKKEPAFLNQQEYKSLLYEAQARGKVRDYAILMTLLQCGLREGELIKLALEDVDLEKPELHVRGRKGGVDTDIPLPSPATDALTKWLAERSKIAQNQAVDHSRVFISKTNRPLDERAIRYLVKYYMKRAGIKKQASAHTLRHTFGAFKSAKNVDLKTLQYWMGHKSPGTTLHYLHLVKKTAPELMEATTL